jgi:hypothetical protein
VARRKSQSRISVAAGADRGYLKDQPKARCAVCSASGSSRIRFMAGLGQPLPGLLSQFGGTAQRELLLHAHLVRLNGFDAYIQFTR